MLCLIHHGGQGPHVVLLRQLEGQHVPSGARTVAAGRGRFLHEHLAHHLAWALDVHHHLHVLHEMPAMAVLQVTRLQSV